MCNTRDIVPSLDFIPTEHYPILWFRLKIDDGSKTPDGNISYFNVEYSFNILSETHNRLLDEMSVAETWVVLYIDQYLDKGCEFCFKITDEYKKKLNKEIEACKNGLALYHDLDTDKFVKGRLEIANSRGLSGDITNIDIVKKQDSRRFSIKPFPEGVDIKFV